MFILLTHVAKLESNQLSASEKAKFNTNKKLKRSI